MADLPPFPSDEKSERRIDARVPFDGPVTQYGDDGNVIWKGVNLSDSGMFLTGNPILPLDAELELGFAVPGYELEILTEARVRWRNHPNDPDFDDTMPAGIGVAFTDIDPECGKVLRKFMASHRPPEPAAQTVVSTPPPAAAQTALSEPPPAAAQTVVSTPPPAAAPPHTPSAPPIQARPTPAPVSAGNTEKIADLIADALDDFVDDGTTETPFSGADDLPLGEEDEALLRERLAPGTVLGSYKLTSWLGSGGMGDVYLAEHTQLGRKVALKRLRSDFANNRAGLQRFFQEARAVNQIHHEHIVEITDFIQEAEHTYCVMEFLDGPTLAEMAESIGIMPLTQILSVSLQVCDALEAVHQAGIVHRDLKPQNIMLIQRIGEPHFVKLLDFGVAKLIEGVDGKIDKRSGAQTTGSMLLGTPAYMSPEQLLGNPVDHRADVYALGVILYEMTTGNNPFVTDTWGQAVVRHATQIPDRPSIARGPAGPLPAELEELILTCLEKDPNKRPESIAEVGAGLRRLLAVGPEHAPLSAPAGVHTADSGGSMGRWFAAAAVLVLLLGGGGLVMVPSLRPGGFTLPWENGDLRVAPGTTAENSVGSETASSEGARETRKGSPEAPKSDPGPTTGTAPELEPAAGTPSTLNGAHEARLGRKGRRKRRDIEVGSAKQRSVEPAAKPFARAESGEPSPKPTPVPKPEPKPAARPEPKPAARPEPKPAARPEPKPAARPEPKTVVATPQPKPAPAAGAAPASKAEQFYEQGKLLLKQNKALLAVEEFKKCLNENPRHARSYKMLGRAYIMLGRESDAIDAFEKYVKLAPNAKDAPKVQAIIDKFRG